MKILAKNKRRFMVSLPTEFFVILGIVWSISAFSGMLSTTEIVGPRVVGHIWSFLHNPVIFLFLAVVLLVPGIKRVWKIRCRQMIKSLLAATPDYLSKIFTANKPWPCASHSGACSTNLT